ncbi:MAG: hypothetical protein GX889_05590 [Clostridiales bacterium]|nr:hypothetical protein [Clostridiales bacterium]
MTIQEVIKNLVGMKVTDDFENDVICAFEDYEYEGETYVIVSKDESNDNIDYQAYIDHADAPIICIKIENNEIIDAWEA